MRCRLSGILLLVLSLATVSARGEQPSGQSVDSTRRLGPAPFELMPQMSMMMPTNFVLSNGEYDVPYSDSIPGFPLLSVGAGIPIGTLGGFEFQGVGRIGYSYKTSLMNVRNAAGETLRDQVRLHWLPISAAVRTMYEIPGFRFLKPTLTTGGGVQWLRQTGNLDGIDTSFWVPYVYFTPAVTILQGGRDDWFGGFTFGTSFQFSLGRQITRAWSYDLSVNIWL